MQHDQNSNLAFNWQPPKSHSGIGNTALPSQVYRLKLELAAELPSLHWTPPVPSKHLNSVTIEPAAATIGNRDPELANNLGHSRSTKFERSACLAERKSHLVRLVHAAQTSR